ncbi:MAG: histidinol-phosphate transaminase [Vicinamibacterales bacterium]
MGDGGHLKRTLGERCQLASNESPLAPSPRVIDAIVREAGHLNRYPARGDADLTAALAAHHGRGLTPAHFVTACSGYETLDLVARAFLAADDTAIISNPAFPVYARTIALQCANVIDVPLDPVTFLPHVDRILAALDDRTRLVYLCNPGNPTGVVTPARLLDALVASLPPHVTLVVDEVYHHFADRGALPDVVAHVVANARVVVVHSFSKAYGLAGLRLGYAIAPPGLAARLASFRREYHLSRLHLAAGLAALEDGEHVARVVALVRAGRDAICAGLDRLGVTHWPSQANFVLFRPPGPARDLHRALAAAGIDIRPTDGFGLPGALRVSVGLADENAHFIDVLGGLLGSAGPTSDLEVRH